MKTASVRFVDGELAVVTDGEDIVMSMVSGPRLDTIGEARPLAGGADLGVLLEEASGGAFGDLWRGSMGLVLEVEAYRGSEEERRRLLSLPWEALALGGVALALDQGRVWAPVRVVSEAGGEREPANRALRMLFMAAAPEGSNVLRFEQEEQRILDATSTGSGPLADVVVEETGTLDELGDRLVDLRGAGVDVVHLTGHGTVGEVEGRPMPVFVAEDAFGDPDPVDAARLGERLADGPGLVFVSSCRGGEEPGQVSSLIAGMVSHGCAAVAGWDISVRDIDATSAAAALYGELAKGSVGNGSGSVAVAAAKARRVLAEQAPVEGPGGYVAWPSLKLVARRGATGALVTAPGSAGRTRLLPARSTAQAFLDEQKNEYQVCSPDRFVGRRRELQSVLRGLRRPVGSGGSSVVELVAVGGWGKTSLAARAADRLDSHDRVVIVGEFNPLVLSSALKAVDPGLAAAFGEAEETLARCRALAGALAQRERPVLVIADDLETNVAGQADNKPEFDETSKVARFAPGCRELLDGLAQAFHERGLASRLLVTSRYSTGIDAAQCHKVALDRLSDAAFRQKLTELDARYPAVAVGKWVDDLEEMSGRNPRLLEYLAVALDTNRHEDDRQQLFDRLAATAIDFRTNVLVGELLVDLSAAQLDALATLAVFAEPISEFTWTAVCDAPSAVPDAVDIAQRRGLLETSTISQQGQRIPHVLVSGLLREHLANRTSTLTEGVAARAAPLLWELWHDDADETRPLECHRLALLTGDRDVADAVVERLGHHWANQSRYADAKTLAEATLELGPLFESYHVAARANQTLGNSEEALTQYRSALALAERDAVDEYSHAAVIHNLANMEVQAGNVDEARRLYNESLTIKEAIGDAQGKAATLHALANMEVQAGNVDEARRLYNESLTINETIGDAQGKAATLHELANMEVQAGNVDEARRLYSESLTINETIGNAQGKAATLANLGHLDFAAGDQAEADGHNLEAATILLRIGAVPDALTVIGNLGVAVGGTPRPEYLAQAVLLGLSSGMPLRFWLTQAGALRAAVDNGKAVTMLKGMVAQVVDGGATEEDAQGLSLLVGREVERQGVEPEVGQGWITEAQEDPQRSSDEAVALLIGLVPDGNWVIPRPQP